MNFEAFNFAEKRIRTAGSREWKLWFTVTDTGLDFRLLTKGSNPDCYVTLQGMATLVEGETAIQEDDNGDGYPTDLYTYKDAQGTVAIYLELGDKSLAWVVASGAYGQAECSFNAPGPLMPQIAG